MPAARRWLRPAVAGLGALVVLVVTAARSAPVAEEGVVLPFFERYEVARTELLGVSLYVDRSSGLSDVVVVAALALIAATLLLGARAVREAALRRTFVDAALGSAFLALDDLLAIHETVGHNLGFLAALPGLDHPDDLVVGLYGLVVCCFGWRHRDLLAGRARLPWALAVVCGGAAVLHDLTSLNRRLLEEGLEVAAAGGLVAAAIVVVREHAGAALVRPRWRLRRCAAAA